MMTKGKMQKAMKRGRTQNPRTLRGWPMEWYLDKFVTERSEHPRSVHE